MKNKLAALFVVVLLAFFILIARVVYINAKNGTEYRRNVLAQEQQSYSSRTIPAKRGDIYDRNGNLLATSNKIYTLIMDCFQINSDSSYIEPTVAALKKFFDLDEEVVRQKLTQESTRDSQYQIMKKGITIEEQKAFEDYVNPDQEKAGDLSPGELAERMKVRGIWFEEDYRRSYPFRELACDTIGFTYSRDSADRGLEGYYNSLLSGVDGREYGYFKSVTDVEQTIIPAAYGNGIVTSLDIGLQQIVEKYVTAYQQQVGGLNVGVVIEDPSTGEILAMDGGDRYDLNEPRNMQYLYTEEEIDAMTDSEFVVKLNAMWNNFCVSDAFEPGSVVKPIIMASALEKGKVVTSDTFECDGYETFGSSGETMIKCAVYPGAHGKESLADVIAYSCNDAMMQIGAKMGAEQFIRGQNDFNFGSRTGIDLPNEGNGIIHTAQSLGQTELATCSFGQGFTCTMIQEINALSAAVNGGYYYQPHLVTAVRDSSGKVIRTIQPTLMRQAVTPTVSKNIREYMKSVIDYGTAYRTSLIGYSMGGKTGTAEKLPRGDGRYLVSFIAFAPVDHPQIVIYCVIDEPKVEDQGSCVHAQYLVQAILVEALPYLKIESDEPMYGNIQDTLVWNKFKGIAANVDETITEPEEGSESEEEEEPQELYDDNGYLIDWNGNWIDEEGYLLDDYRNYIEDGNGDHVLSDSIKGLLAEENHSRAEGGHINRKNLREAISDLNIPEPLTDYSNVIFGNSMESEGLTNEEAGLD
ncbi:MAG: penicillin-binding protein 2 [Blautia sp.]|nr:penicillin-binding protein 2 [Blautia sp.]